MDWIWELDLAVVLEVSDLTFTSKDDVCGRLFTAVSFPADFNNATKDPLFQIEKVFDKVKYMDIDPDQIENFFEAAEEWNSAVNMSNSMAFISQFGEYNPGGGKDEVLKYLEEARKQVITAKGALKKIIDALGL